MRAYVDTDVLVWHLRGDPHSSAFLRELRAAPDCEFWTGAMQRAEVLFFMRAGEEERTRLLLAQFRTAAVDQAVIDKAASLYRRWHPSHGVDINDAILAATAIETGGQIFCLNTKHYPMPDVLVRRAW
jgi:predicted nucleic acid-binding protein